MSYPCLGFGQALVHRTLDHSERLIIVPCSQRHLAPAYVGMKSSICFLYCVSRLGICLTFGNLLPVLGAVSSRPGKAWTEFLDVS